MPCFRDLFYFNIHESPALPPQRLEWIALEIQELKRSLRRYMTFIRHGMCFHDVVEEIVERLNHLYRNLGIILYRADMVFMWPDLQFEWPVADLLD